MDEKRRIYLAIDLKSFYASVECVDQGLDPLTTNLVVADISKTTKTICLAVTPSLKKYGISGRARLFEVVKKVNEINMLRKRNAPNRTFIDESYDDVELQQHPEYELSYIAAPPRMAFYLEYSRQIYEVYLKYVSPQDIHVYSIDEVFIDATSYLSKLKVTPRELAKNIILDILYTTGITAAAGIGTNLYLCKVAMDIVAKHVKADKDGVRIAQLDEVRYRKLLWNHTPITDFWRVGRGYKKRLADIGIYTMGDIARCSIAKEDAVYNEDTLYKIFGINAELLIDHAWGHESCTMEDIKAFKPSNNSIGTGQVLTNPYPFDKAKIILKEMLEVLTLQLVEKELVCDQIVLYIGYDIENVENDNPFVEEVTTDFYGRKVPKHAHGSAHLPRQTSSTRMITKAVIQLYDRIVNPHLTIRRLNISANHVVREDSLKDKITTKQMDLFIDYDALEKKEEKETKDLEKEKRLQQATLQIKKKYGKNAVLKVMDLEEGANMKERNKTIGGHKA